MPQEWYYAQGGQRRGHGPITTKQLKELAVSGELRPTDLVWTEGKSDWKPASIIKGLFPEDKRHPTPPLPHHPPTPPNKTVSESTRTVHRESGQFLEKLSATSENAATIAKRMRRKLATTDWFMWIKDLPLLYLRPGSFYERRAAERTLYPALFFCVGYTFLISLIPLLVIAAKVGSSYTPWRMLIYLPLTWVAAVGLRGLLLGLVIKAKAGTPITTAFQQGFTIDSFSWMSFFTYWLFATLWLFADAHPPTTVGPYVVVGVIGLLCRLHGYFLDLCGLSTISGIGRAVAGILVLVIDGLSSFIILFVMSFIFYNAFSS